jgi:hypothetical protein
MGGVNLVAGFRPELRHDALPAEAPVRLTGCNDPVVGGDGFTMPATQHDAGKLKVELGGQVEVLAPPRRKDIDRQMIVDLRRMPARAT